LVKTLALFLGRFILLAGTVVGIVWRFSVQGWCEFQLSGQFPGLGVTASSTFDLL